MNTVVSLGGVYMWLVGSVSTSYPLLGHVLLRMLLMYMRRFASR